MRVKAIKAGFYKGSRIRPGTIFSIDSEKQFSSKWMEKIDNQAPILSDTTDEQTTTTKRRGNPNWSKKEVTNV